MVVVLVLKDVASTVFVVEIDDAVWDSLGDVSESADEEVRVEEVGVDVGVDVGEEAERVERDEELAVVDDFSVKDD